MSCLKKSMDLSSIKRVVNHAHQLFHHDDVLVPQPIDLLAGPEGGFFALHSANCEHQLYQTARSDAGTGEKSLHQPHSDLPPLCIISRIALKVLSFIIKPTHAPSFHAAACNLWYSSPLAALQQHWQLPGSYHHMHRATFTNVAAFH